MSAKKKTHVHHLEKNAIAEAFGWVGSFSILTGYALLSLGVLNGDSPVYHLIFMIGSAGLALITYRHKAYQSLVVNLTFVFLAFVALTRIVFFA